MNRERRLFEACKTGRIETVKRLIEEEGVDPSAHNNDAVIWAAWNGHIKVVKYLCSLPIEKGVDPSAMDNLAVRGAAQDGHLDVVKYLCSLSSVDPSAWDNDAVSHAAGKGYLEIVKYLCELPLDRRVDPRGWNNLAIKLALNNGYMEVVKYLMTRAVKSKEEEKRATKWWRKSKLTDVYDERDMRIEVMVVRERMKWKIPHQMMDRILVHLFKMKVRLLILRKLTNK